jgi:hypothetical protein
MSGEHRTFYDLGVADAKGSSESGGVNILSLIQSSIVGGNLVFQGAFGPRPCIYADWTASGRSVDFIEDFVRDEVKALVMRMYSVVGTLNRASSLGLAILWQHTHDELGHWASVHLLSA